MVGHIHDVFDSARMAGGHLGPTEDMWMHTGYAHAELAHGNRGIKGNRHTHFCTKSVII